MILVKCRLLVCSVCFMFAIVLKFNHGKQASPGSLSWALRPLQTNVLRGLLLNSLYYLEEDFGRIGIEGVVLIGIDLRIER